MTIRILWVNQQEQTPNEINNLTNEDRDMSEKYVEDTKDARAVEFTQKELRFLLDGIKRRIISKQGHNFNCYGEIVLAEKVSDLLAK